MKFEISAELGYSVSETSALLLNIHALRTPRQKVVEESFTIDPYMKAEEIVPAQGENRFVRIEIAKTANLSISYRATVDNYFEVNDYTKQQPISVAQLDPSVFQYLHPSRYCQSDKLYRFAETKFGKIKNPFSQVIALTNWINENVLYLSGSTNSQTSAYDTVTELAGVCRDFAHLGIALCRALTIPARYFTGYAYQLQPPDFHACFEAYIGNEWVLFDPTKLVPLNGLVKIATGRDAAETAVASIYGMVQFNMMSVTCELAEKNFIPFYYDTDAMKGISYK